MAEKAVEAKPPEGGLRVGATARVSVKELGREFCVEFVVEALEPDARLAYHLSTPMFRPYRVRPNTPTRRAIRVPACPA